MEATKGSEQRNFHGLALWFDVMFDPIVFEDEYASPFSRVELRKGPADTPSHWKQTVLVITENMGAGECAQLCCVKHNTIVSSSDVNINLFLYSNDNKVRIHQNVRFLTGFSILCMENG